MICTSDPHHFCGIDFERSGFKVLESLQKWCPHSAVVTGANEEDKGVSEEICSLHRVLRVQIFRKCNNGEKETDTNRSLWLTAIRTVLGRSESHVSWGLQKVWRMPRAHLVMSGWKRWSRKVGLRSSGVSDPPSGENQTDQLLTGLLISLTTITICRPFWMRLNWYLEFLLFFGSTMWLVGSQFLSQIYNRTLAPALPQNPWHLVFLFKTSHDIYRATPVCQSPCSRRWRAHSGQDVSFSFSSDCRLFVLYWGVADEQHRGSLGWIVKGLSHTRTRIHSTPNPAPIRLAHNIEQSSVFYTVSIVGYPCWLSILNTAVCTWSSQTP